MNYSLIRITRGGNNHLYIIGADRVETFAEEIEADSFEILDQVPGSDLIGTSYTHPLWKTEMPLIGGDHVTADSGTGLVHTAPGHGMEDYEVCQKLGIEPFSPGMSVDIIMDLQ